MAFQQNIQFMDGAFVAPTFADWQGRAAALGLKRSGRELVGACPACGGNDRFAVKPTEGGASLIHCRGCKGFIDIVKAAGFAEDRPTNGAVPTREFQYRDLLGEHYHSAFRRGDGPDKKCWQRAGFKDRPLPYRIEHRADFLDLPVVIVEGEPKADRLAALGYAAVSWCGGAHAVLRTRWDALAGYDAILWPDHDTPGVKAMQRLGETLEAFGGPVRWVSVPDGKPKGWDCMDASEGDIHELIEGAGDFVVSLGAGRDDETFVPTMAEFLTADLTPPEFLIEGLFTAAGVNAIGAKPDTGKTTFERSLAMAVARGETFLGRRAKQGPVFLGLFEEDAAFTRDFLLKLGATANDPVYPCIRPAPEHLFDRLASWVDDKKPALVILDTMAKAMPGVDLNDYSEVNRAITPYVNLARSARTCILFSHHNRKGEGGDTGEELLGSTAIRGNIDTTLIIRPDGNRRVMETTQRYGANMPETYLDIDEATGRIQAAGEKRETRRSEMRESILCIVGEAGEPMKKSQIEEKVTGGANAIRAMCDRLAKEGALKSWKKGNAIMYALPN